MSTNLFRTCPESGLQFHKPAELLMRVNAVFAVVILLFGGITALLAMLNSCASGVTVVNIDNGFGAAFAAVKYLKQIVKSDKETK